MTLYTDNKTIKLSTNYLENWVYLDIDWSGAERHLTTLDNTVRLVVTKRVPA